MKPVAIPATAKQARPWAHTVVVGPPANDTLGCTPVEALIDHTADEGITFRIPWRPEPADLAAIEAGEPIWLALWCPQMPPVALSAGPA